MDRNAFLSTARRFLKAFRQVYITFDTLETKDFDDFNGRILRYAILFSMYDNTMYDQLRSWAVTYRTNYSLYRYIRNIYNPSNRLVEFWRTVVWGGALDDEAGEEGSIPIIGASTELRKAISTVWQYSNMSAIKDIITLYGCSMGDVGIKVVDSPSKQRAFLEVVHPNTIRDIVIDQQGHCQGYVLEETRQDEKGRDVSYVEVCERASNDLITFKTFKDGELFAWNGEAASWSAEYGFVPFGLIRHNYVGSTWGWAEVQAHRSKVHEVDEQASKLHDYVRKVIDPIWLFNFKKPKKDPNLRNESSAADTSNPQPGREEVPSLYVPDSRAKGQPLVAEGLSISEVAGIVQNVIAELERDLPELQMDIWTAGGYTTGKALRTARQRVEKKVLQRRPGYDKPLVALNNMAVAIGGERGYPGYEGFNLGSFARGEMKHSIPAERPVFDTDALEEVERKQVFWNTILSAIEKRLPKETIETMLVDLGWSEQKASKFVSALPEEPLEPETDLGDEQDVQNDKSPVGQTQ